MELLIISIENFICLRSYLPSSFNPHNHLSRHHHPTSWPSSCSLLYYLASGFGKQNFSKDLIPVGVPSWMHDKLGKKEYNGLFISIIHSSL